MLIEKLQMELRPRSPAQALDLGFALLRTCAYHAYMSFAMLMLPFALLAGVLCALWPEQAVFWMMIPFWFKPIIERGPLYVLSRQVFGTHVSWVEAVRAWPRQLGGGTFALLTWFRLFSAGRSLVQPVWQLENARGKVASDRRQTLGGAGTARSAFWFGVICMLLEVVVLLGTLYFIASIASTGPESSVIEDFFLMREDLGSLMENLVHLAVILTAYILIGPIYTACGFALYLNRRAALEAWDIELKLRQIVRPAASSAPSAPRGTLAILLATMFCALTLGAAPDVLAAREFASREACLSSQERERYPVTGPKAQAIRQEVDALYSREALRTTKCVERRVSKDRKEVPDLPDVPTNDYTWLADLLQAIVIAAGIGAAAYLLYRYRGYLPSFRRGGGIVLATEVGGLDIRAESLPAKVTDEVLRLWDANERRPALALLYRATLSRLVTDDRLLLRQGDTEGDCLRAAASALRAGQLAQARLDVANTTTSMWLGGAYGGRWPATDQVRACCAAWDGQFTAAARSAA